MEWIRRLRLALILIVLGGASYWGYQYWNAQKGDLPSLDMDDVTPANSAGTVDVIRGDVHGAGAVGAEFAPVQLKSTFKIGSVFRLARGAFLQVKMTGNFTVVMDGEGEFVLEKARVSADRMTHTLHWLVRKGQIRVKPSVYDTADKLIEVRTITGRMIGQKAEFGLRVDSSGGGQVWLMSGKAHLLWNDGRRKDLVERGMDYI